MLFNKWLAAVSHTGNAAVSHTGNNECVGLRKSGSSCRRGAPRSRSAELAATACAFPSGAQTEVRSLRGQGLAALGCTTRQRDLRAEGKGRPSELVWVAAVTTVEPIKRVA